MKPASNTAVSYRVLLGKKIPIALHAKQKLFNILTNYDPLIAET